MALTFVVIGILVVAGLIFIQFEHHTKKLKVGIAIIFGTLLLLAVMGFYNSGQTDFSSVKSAFQTFFLFFTWMWDSSLEIWDAGVEFTGKVIGIVT